MHVVRLKQSPHDKTQVLDQFPAVVVYLSDANHKHGDATYIKAATQASENASDQPSEKVVIELKPGATKSKSPPITLDPVKLDPQHHIVLLENNRVRVIRTILEPHLKAPIHQHPHYVVVYLTELHTTMTMSDGKEIDNVRKPGEIAWRDRLQHATENIGHETAMEIQVELK